MFRKFLKGPQPGGRGRAAEVRPPGKVAGRGAAVPAVIPARFRNRRRGERMSKDSALERYSRQMRFAGIGEKGQRKLLDGRVTLCGCGALGTVLANALVRAGVGHVRIVDRDFIETHNLQRQILFDENDVAESLPKAEAAAR